MPHKRRHPDTHHQNSSIASPASSHPNKAARTTFNDSPHTASTTSNINHAHIPAYDTKSPIGNKNSTLPPLPLILNPQIELAVFTHDSFVPPAPLPTNDTAQPLPANLTNYQSLEFLGDAYLELIASRLIFTHFPSLSAGRQSTLRESLVWNPQLARFAEAYGFEGRLRAQKGCLDGMKEKKREKLRADLVEAYVAGVVLADPEKGFRRCEEWLGALWERDGLLKGKEDVGWSAGVGAGAGEVAGDAGANGDGHEQGYGYGPAQQEVQAQPQQKPDTSTPKDKLARLISTRDSPLSYITEFSAPITTSSGLKRHQSTVAVYIATTRTADDAEGRVGEKTVTFLGRGTGDSGKEAGMAAARDAIEGSGSEKVRVLAERKVAAELLRKAEAGDANGRVSEGVDGS